MFSPADDPSLGSAVSSSCIASTDHAASSIAEINQSMLVNCAGYAHFVH